MNGRTPPAGRLALALGPLIAFLLYAPSIGGTFLSDDFLVNTMLHHADATVNWGEILADFGRSWAGLENSYLYRPFVSLSWALTYSLGGMDPMPFHLTNVCLHALATLACAVLCAHCTPARPGAAAVLGGVLFALHPIAAEPACWIASRTAGLQVMFATGAMACFAGYLRVGGRWRQVAAALCLLGALLSKESAVLVPFSLLALDLLIRGPRGGWSSRWKIHAPMFGILGGYFLLRLAVLGSLLGGPSEHLKADVGANLRDKIAMVFAPVGNGLPEPWGYVAGALVLLGIAALVVRGFVSSSTRPFAVLGLLWLVLYFAPTYPLAVDPVTLIGSRMIYGATAILALWVSWLALRTATGPTLGLGAGLLFAGLLALGAGRMLQYRAAFGDMRHLQRSLAAQARSATPEHPLVFVTVNPPSLGIPFLNCNALYPLVEIPVAAVDTPAVSVGCVLQPVPFSEDLLFHTGVLRALREQGGWLLDWFNYPPERPEFVVRRREPGTAPALPDLQPGRPGEFLAASLDPWNIEVVEIEVAGDCAGGRLEWLYRGAEGRLEKYSSVVPPLSYEAAPRFATFAKGIPGPGHTVFHVDVTGYLSFLAVPRLAGFHVALDGPGEVTGVRLRSRVGDLPLPAPLRDAVIDLDGPGITAPERPAGTDRMSLYLIGPDTAVRMDVAGAGPVTITPRLREAIAIILRCSRQKRWYYYFEATGTRSYRTPVDWVRLRR